MCGIAGALLFRQQLGESVWMERLGRMVQTLHHRGPDDHGCWSNGGIGLAHARLSVIDLSSAGHQPMATPDGSLVVVFNGEIYNFRELREALEGLGYRFRSHTDTEVLLHGYHAWGGHGLLQRLEGMFAFAMWDERRKELFLARDRFGKKPLYYYHDGEKLVFGSEIKALLPFPGVPREPDYEAIHHYLTYQYVPAPWTAFRGIRKLSPGHFLRHRAAPGQPAVERYWRLQLPQLQNPAAGDENQLAEEFRLRFLEAVHKRMVADVPLGAFLSGGVDSSAVVAAMARLGGGPVKTFSIGFENREYDETRYARLVAEQYGTEHHEEVVHPNAVSILPKLVWHYGEPFADPSAIPTFYVSELTRRHVTVALSGDGGDELFLGYSRYQSLFQAERDPAVLRTIARVLQPLVTALPRRVRAMRSWALLERYLDGYARDRARRYAPYLVYYSDEDKEQGYGEALAPWRDDSSLALLRPFLEAVRDPVLAAAWADIHTYLPDDILVKVDVASMAYSLETRAPFLDHRFAEWAMGLPLAARFRPGESKRIMKKALEPWLPKEILYRRKMGFGVPIERWLCGPLAEMAQDLLLGSRFEQRGIVHRGHVQAMLEEHCQGLRLHHTRLWALLILELWFQTWIDE